MWALRRCQTSEVRSFLALCAVVVLAIGIGVTFVAHGVSQSGILQLSEGRSSARFVITAPAPPTHTYDVEVETAASASVGVHIQTWYGQALGVLDSTRTNPACEANGARTACLLRFPALEAQCPGRWYVIASKISGPSVKVNITVTFQAVKGDLVPGRVTRC